MIERVNDVIIDHDSHIYTHVETGANLRSVSSVYREYIEPFDRENISWMVARKQLRNELVAGWVTGDQEPTEAAIEERKQVVLAEWDTKRDTSADYGTDIHSTAEDIQNGKEIEDKKVHLQKLFKAEYGHYHKFFPEFLVHSMKWGVAGLIDNPMIRQRSSKSIIDIDDFKTNVIKGIVFDSTKLQDNGKLKHYNRFMLGPLLHLEDCNYNHYAMQQSIYGVLLQEMFPLHKIGKLTLTFIEIINDKDIRYEYKLTRIPLPYLKMEATAVLNAYNEKYPFKIETIKKVNEEYDADDF